MLCHVSELHTQFHTPLPCVVDDCVPTEHHAVGALSNEVYELHAASTF